jgi:hypothetical protein
MSASRPGSTSQFRADRPDLEPLPAPASVEQEAVRTTIVGGRPPGSGKPLGNIPCGVEVLLKKAAVDPGFRQQLLETRAAVAKTIGLHLEPAEVLMLSATPQQQLEAIIQQVHVPSGQRRAFLGTAAAAMLAAMGMIVVGCTDETVTGIRPDNPDDGKDNGGTRGSRPDDPPPREDPTDAKSESETLVPSRGIRPDVPPSRGIDPDVPPPKESSEEAEVAPRPVTLGIQPDMPRRR